MKLEIAKRAAKLLAKIPSIKMVAVTGNLAMENATKESDIDLMIVTDANTLWLSRLLALILLAMFRIPFRRAGRAKEQDRLCLNLWLDETVLIWDKDNRNIYTAHELAQVIPLVNKNQTYEKLLLINRWILKYWPNSVKLLPKKRIEFGIQRSNPLTLFLEKIAFNLQYFYMKSKITRETVTCHKALFHPKDLGKIVLDRLKNAL